MLKSLLWRNNNHSDVINEKQFKTITDDLNLRDMLDIMSKVPTVKLSYDIFLKNLTSDYETIRYRQCILQDFINKGSVSDDLEKLIYLLRELAELNKGLKPESTTPRLMLRLKKLKIYFKVLETFEKIFSNGDDIPVSKEFEQIANSMNEMIKSKGISNFKNTLLEISKIIDKTKSLTIGANLDSQSSIKESIILSLNDFAYDKSDLLSKFKMEIVEKYEKMPITPEIDLTKQDFLLVFSYEINKELDELLKDDLNQIENLLDEYKDIITSEMLLYLDEVAMYFGALRLCKYLKDKGLYYCFPDETTDEIEVEEIFSLSMLYGSQVNNDMVVVSNSIKIKKEEKILLLTGPNNGGKTVLLDALAIAQLLFQNGMIVPARSVKMQIFKSFSTHFPKNEDVDKGMGRLGEEADRISKILDCADEGGLVLFNEPYVTTNPVEGLDVLCITINKFIERGLMVFLVTHYLDFLEKYNKENVVSYVLQMENMKTTYIAKRSRPMNESFAKSIAKSLGIDKQGIMDLHQGVRHLDDEENIQ